MGFVALYPSYKSGTLEEQANAQIQMMRLISSSKRISDSIRTSRHARFAFHV